VLPSPLGGAQIVSCCFRLTAAFLALTLVAGATAATGSSPELLLVYTAGNTLEVTLAGGPTLTASSPTGQIPFGAYQVVILDDASDGSDPVHMFEFSGPGLNLTTDLQGGDDKSEIYTETLAANSGYTFADSALPGLAPIVFRTTGTPASGASPGQTTPAQTATTTTSGTSSSSSQYSNSGVVGSGLAKEPFRGTLTGTVSSTGKLLLTDKGKNVSTLEPGRYLISVLDRSTKNGFIVQQIRKPALTLTGGSFVGTRTKMIVLAAGQWFFYATFTGKKTYFIVVR
jgi:hypothetical protein